MLLLTLAAFQFFLVFATARPFWKRHHKHHHGLTNAFKILAVDRFAVALRDVNQDPMLKCLTATRVDLDPDVPSATFQWSFNAGKRNATLHFTKGPSIDTANVVVDSDTAHPDVARYLYADPAVTCAIMELRYFGYPMSSASPLLVLAFVQLFVHLALVRASTEKHDVNKTESADAFEILAALPFAMAIKDTNTNPLFKCLTAKRVQYDPRGPSATYEWSLNAGDGKPR
ncbi:hypothetical protein HPB50_005546 [Hyalomma asiaticum]|uniref:Uncharacterized protein n=1 Tax=Hyalomma asiaticum TaxID=266040 RepID=A0ACB7S1F0_HYAAI|nr:hypothetical protein HPB50_005546 [Hyalomma asiaticum]